MDKVPIPVLSMIDGVIGVGEMGYKADQLNAFINIKASEKLLQFCPKTFQKNLVWNPEQYKLSDPLVDEWKVKYEEERISGIFKLTESLMLEKLTVWISLSCKIQAWLFTVK